MNKDKTRCFRRQFAFFFLVRKTIAVPGGHRFCAACSSFQPTLQRYFNFSYLPWHTAISALHGCFKVSHVPSPCCSEFLRIASSLSKKSLSGCVFGRDGDSLYILIDLTTCLVYPLQVLQR